MGRMMHRAFLPPRPTCTACGRWLRRYDTYRDVCINCGELQGNETRAVGAVCAVFGVGNPWVPTPLRPVKVA